MVEILLSLTSLLIISNNVLFGYFVQGLVKFLHVIFCYFVALTNYLLAINIVALVISRGASLY